MEVARNHFVSDFFHPNQENSGFEIVPKLLFQDKEYCFDELTFMVFGIVRFQNHFFSITPPQQLQCSRTVEE